MDQAVIDHVVTIVQLLAKGADHKRLSPMQVDRLNKNIETLMNHESDEFIDKFLAMVRGAASVLIPNVGEKLIKYP
jgi:hypothetical protein